MPAKRPCLDCRTPTPRSSPRCTTCQRRADRARGTLTQRGYGSTTLTTPLGTMTYDQCKRTYQQAMDAGRTYQCADHCGATINPTDWHLGHHEHDRTVIVGPLTPNCNLTAAGRSSHPTLG